MSDFSIPGVTSKYKTSEMIDKLMEVERIPLTRMKDEVDTFKKQKSVWLSLNRKISTFRDNSRELYSFQNPFNSKIAESSDTDILTANATRTALEEKKKIIVKQIAHADRFLSRPLDKDFRAEKGLYRFKVGDKEVKFNFSGGSLNELAALINKRGADLIRASVVADSDKSRVMAIEALKTGLKNPLSLHDQALTFGLTLTQEDIALPGCFGRLLGQPGHFQLLFPFYNGGHLGLFLIVAHPGQLRHALGLGCQGLLLGFFGLGSGCFDRHQCFLLSRDLFPHCFRVVETLDLKIGDSDTLSLDRVELVDRFAGFRVRFHHLEGPGNFLATEDIFDFPGNLLGGI